MTLDAKELLGKTLLIFTAHPDDEAFLVAGTIWENKQRGGKALVICATAGEKGLSHLTKKVSHEKLKQIRKKELVELCKFIGVDKLHILNFHDAKLTEEKKKLTKKFTAYISKYCPDCILSFGPDGISGHLDHVCCGDIARKAAKENNIKFLAFCSPPLTKHAQDWLLKRRRFGKYHNHLDCPMPKVTIKINPEIKLKAFGFHKSQKPLEKLPKNTLKAILNHEYFS